MNTSIRNGLQAGLIFSILIIFLILIGFMVTGAELISDALGLDFETPAGSVSTTVTPVASDGPLFVTTSV